MKRTALAGLAGIAWLVTGCWVVPVWAADERPASSTVRKTAQGLHFNVPADWPIEERNGAVGPVPVEEYLSMKFKAIEGRLQAMDQQVGGLDLRLRVVEEQLKEQPKGMRSAEQGKQP